MEDTVTTNLKELIENILITNIKELRKTQNQRYYAKHREERLEKIKAKMECTLCHKQVSISNMNRHIKRIKDCINKDSIRKNEVTEI
jgi:septin family protein